MTDRGTIKSCWRGFSCEFEHKIHQIPDAYGSEITFLHKNGKTPENFDEILRATNQMSTLIMQFNAPSIPIHLNNDKALLLLLDKLKSACKKSNPASEQWPWKKIEEDLLTTLNFPSLQRSELCKEFQLWMQEMLPQYFIDLA
jgi:hypothetical protein